MTDNLLTAHADETQMVSPDIPAKFMNPETGEVRMEALLKSYKELERKLSSMPQAHMPKEASEYKVNCEHGLFTPEDDLNKKMFEANFTQDQVQLVYDMAAERLVPMILEMAEDFEADRQTEKLIAHFGGEAQWKEVSRQLLAFGQKNLPGSVLKGLTGSFEGVLALYRMMKGDVPEFGSSESNSIASDENELKSMVRDPRYWKQKDPSFVQKVTEGFERFYSEK